MLTLYIIRKDSVRTSQNTHFNFSKDTNRRLLYEELMGVDCQHNMEHINTVRGQNTD
jgi:hypothetical protein